VSHRHHGHRICDVLLVQRLCGRYENESTGPRAAPQLTPTGLGVLFGKLQQGVQENQQILTVARMRADAEEVYGNSLSNIGPATERINGGFNRDEGASVRKVGACHMRF
jgi:hypothetical protein